MQSIRLCDAAASLCRADRAFTGRIRPSFCATLAAIFLLAACGARAQETATSAAQPDLYVAEDSAGSTESISEPIAEPIAEPGVAAEPVMMGVWPWPSKKPKKPVESELIFEGMVSYGNWQVFGTGPDCKLYFAGVEYDRHSWGHLVGSRVDYVAEFQPFVLLRQPAKINYYGVGRSKNYVSVPGIGIGGIGARFQWRSGKKVMPFGEMKGGVMGFTKKVLSPASTYENFSFQSMIGVQVMMNDRWGLRLGLFGDFHISNGTIADINPGLDVMNANFGVSYHFKTKTAKP